MSYSFEGETNDPEVVPEVVVVETADGPIMIDPNGEVIWGDLLDDEDD